MATERLYLGSKVETLLMDMGARRPIGVVMELLDLGEKYARRFLTEGVLPEECREWREQQLVRKLGLASIDEILAKPKAEQAA